MKIIHTSDWHLGQNFHSYDRKEDHDSMVEQLGKIINREQPDALVIAGDIFDVATPSTSVQKSFAEYIVKLHELCPSMTIVCISGNHDSASRHEVFQTPWEALNVKMIGKIDSSDFTPNIIAVTGKGTIVAVPYTNERFLDDAFYNNLEEAVNEVAEKELPIIYVGHAAISGCNFSGHEVMNERFIGGIEYTNIDQLGTIYDYVALGHIHKSQTFNNGKARYSGSPLAVGFDEASSGYDHGFSIIEIESHGKTPVIRTEEVNMVHPLVNIPSEGHAAWDEVIEELKDFPADIAAYIRLNVLLKDDQLLPYDKENQIATALSGKKGLYALINPTREITTSEEDESSKLTSMTMEELQKTDPLTVLKSHALNEGFGFTDEYNEMFNQVLKIVKEGDHEN